jgi:hypothetical protein
MNTEQMLNDLEKRLHNLEMRFEEVSEEEQPEPITPSELLLPEEVRREAFINAIPEWVSNGNYAEGALVKHGDKVWQALPDVTDYPPDKDYDLDANTGGWAPFEY